MRGEVGIEGDLMPRCECSAKVDEVGVKERLADRKVQQPDSSSGIKEVQVLFWGHSSDQAVLRGSAGKAVCVVVIAKQVERPVRFDIKQHTYRLCRGAGPVCA